jgi:hypothetical protein
MCHNANQVGWLIILTLIKVKHHDNNAHLTIAQVVRLSHTLVKGCGFGFDVVVCQDALKIIVRKTQLD